MDRRAREELRQKEESFFVRSNYPRLQKVEAVFNRLVKASGLDDIAWEICVINEPCRYSPRSYPAALQLAEAYVSI